MLCQVTQEFLEEYISVNKIELGYEIVEHLCTLRDDIECAWTKKFLQEYIDEYAEEFKVCKDCMERLEPIIKKEYHNELDNSPHESFVSGYKCPCCDRQYNY